MTAEANRSSDFGELLRARRRVAGLTQEELAERSELSVRAVSDLERGRTARPYPRSARMLADALKLAGTDRELFLSAATSASRPGPAPDPDISHQPVPGSADPRVPGSADQPVPGRVAQPVRPVVAPPDGSAIPRQLPVDVSHFTGRDGELAALTTWCRRAREGTASAAMVISGTAGVGKTALAVHWAHQAAAMFPDGQLYVNLRGHHPDQPMPATEALAAFLRALGLHGQDIPDDEAERAARYRSLLAGRRMLVVADNAAEVRQIRPLIPGDSACAMLVTSRDMLAGLVARDGAHRIGLPVLSVSGSVQLLRTMIGPAADADPGAATELARQCCRLPLALRIAAELAVARRGQPVKDLVTELADQGRRLDLLTADGDQDTALRIVFSWSYRHLDGTAAHAFRLLGLHPGPDIDGYGAAALTGTSLEQCQRMLALLARAHLVEPTGPGRFAMHDLLASYARELADADGLAAQQLALTRLFDHYLRTSGAAVQTLFPAFPGLRHQPLPAAKPATARPATARPATAGPATAKPAATKAATARPAATEAATARPTAIPAVHTPAAARTWLDTQRSNLATITAYTAAHGWPRHATQLAATLFPYLWCGGHVPEALIIHGNARRAATRTGDLAAEAAELNSLGETAMLTGREQRAADYLRQSWRLARAAGDESVQASALGNIGVLHRKRGRYQAAIGHYRQSLGLFRKADDRAGMALALTRLAVICLYQGQYEQAASQLRDSLVLTRASGDSYGQACALRMLGNVGLKTGDYQQARHYLQRSLAIASDRGDRGNEIPALTSLGETELRLGRHRKAVGYYRQSLGLARATGSRFREAEARCGLGEVYLADGQPDQARVQLTAALRLSADDDRYGQARSSAALGRCYAAQSAVGQARRLWQAALATFEDLGAPEAGEVRALLAASRSTPSSARAG